MRESFCGAKAALFYQDSLLVYLRDDKPGLPFAACWDFPGGGREGQESPFACLQRETTEEFGILLRPEQLLWQCSYPSWHQPGVVSLFMVGQLDAAQVSSIRFGDEGQYWGWMTPAAYLGHRAAVPYLQQRLQHYLQHMAG
ncbi:NUDIX domain-containing protein [Aquitalea palustris]|uniref:8-oxo-dGTP diphosphatase n=1 Tax=Aquitalea palustris TaxID=2480983 RepID=A0A454JCZ3_9NEIS|nr:NUDIX hydrolase [Aquitalea palustris]RMC90893.1 NUDIX domain-containing protein [Aquitalea palustris]